jgi:hypothetical protein
MKLCNRKLLSTGFINVVLSFCLICRIFFLAVLGLELRA